MPLFKLRCESQQGDTKTFYYNTDDSSFTSEDGSVFSDGGANAPGRPVAQHYSKDNPLRKSRSPSQVKIQMGLSCNYSCGYCSQKYVERAEETSAKYVPSFLLKLENLDLPANVKFEFWGGEPFVYWKTMKPLAEALREKYPDCRMSVVTNGSLLDKEKVDWLYDMGFGLAMSHDGPQQSYRGPDPFDDPELKAVILYAFQKFGRQRMSFNSVMHKGNTDRAAIIKYFVDLTGDPQVFIGEGGFADIYDDEAKTLSFQLMEEHFEFRRKSFYTLLTTDVSNMVRHRIISEYMRQIHEGTRIETITAKCNIDAEDSLTIDLRGDVLTCQNTSSKALSQNGQPHKVGTLDDFDNVRLDTITHITGRKDCMACPVVHSCMGGCVYLDGEYFDLTCATSYTEQIVYLAYTVFRMTGYIPVWIDGGDLPPERRDIWGTIVEHVEPKKKRVIQIKEIA